MCLDDLRSSSETAMRLRYFNWGTAANIAANLPRYLTLIPRLWRASTRVLPSIGAAVWSRHSRICSIKLHYFRLENSVNKSSLNSEKDLRNLGAERLAKSQQHPEPIVSVSSTARRSDQDDEDPENTRRD